jgi:RND family efflux transporter MFP subunit
VGRVTSVSQASISALAGGQITSLPHTLGDKVAAGSVIASFENSSQQAAVLQAQGSYDAALAGQSAVSVSDARASAINSYRTAFNTLDTMLKSEIGLFFGNRTAYGPQLLLETPDDNLYGKLSLQFDALGDKLDVYRENLANANSADPAQLLVSASELSQEFSDFLTQLAVAANRSTSGATSAQLTALSSARSGISGLIASLASATQSYRSASVTTTSSTDASVTIALGGLRAAQANLEKTYVRAPISGTIVSLPVNRGDFITPGTLVAVISNPGALQVESYVTSADAATLKVGSKATIEGGTQGTIVFIAPALDPTTGKVQVKVGLGAGAALSDGSTVSVVLDRAQSSKSSATNALTIPIAAAKITPQGPVVFTVASSTLVAHAVVFGTVVGGQVTVSSGITADMAIVIDARGLSDGQAVVVDAQ